jgi:hypothetical protein
MLIVQKYNSLNEIENEFKDTLEKLIASDIPHLSILERAEKDKPAEHVFYYYLFFGQTSNMPVGLAFIELVNLPETEFTPFMERMLNKLKKKNAPKWLRFTGPGKLKNFFFFEPKHLTMGQIELVKIIQEMKNRDDVSVIEEWVNAQSIAVLPLSNKKSYKNSKMVVAPLKKNSESYEAYFNNLSAEHTGLVKLAWKGLTRDKLFAIEDVVDPDKIPAHHKLKVFSTSPLTGQVFSDESGPVASVIYLEAGNGNLYTDFLIYKDNSALTPTMLLQTAIMRFYEHEKASVLNFLEDPNLSENDLRGFGLTPMNLEHTLEPKNDYTAGILREDDLRRYS